MGPLVLAPHVCFADVARAFRDWTGGPADLTPQLGGEPVVARWTRDEVEVTYTANPALGLRVLEGDGLRLLDRSPATLTVEQAAGLAGSADDEDVLLGVTALGLLADPAGLPILDRLGASANPDLAAAVALASRRIGLAGLRLGTERLAGRRDRTPGLDPVLGLLRPTSARRQVLRLFLADPPADRDRLLEVVRAGLSDPDWEVAWTALIGAHDHRLAGTLRDLRRCAPAPERRVRVVLDALRQVVGHQLAGTRPTVSGAARAEALLRAVPARPDDDALLVLSLRDPVPVAVDDGSPAPSRGCSRVPPVPHWLGRDGTGIRRVRPPAAFDVATRATVDVPRTRVAASLRALGRDHGRRLRLPTSDELEMATRGPDGRRFPWGNAREPGWRRALSAWGLAGPLHTLEWVDDGDGVHALLPARHGCGAGPVPAQTAAVRAVVAED